MEQQDRKGAKIKLPESVVDVFSCDTPIDDRFTPHVRSDQQKYPVALVPPAALFLSHWSGSSWKVTSTKTLSMIARSSHCNLAGVCGGQPANLRDEVVGGGGGMGLASASQRQTIVANA